MTPAFTRTVLTGVVAALLVGAGAAPPRHRYAGTAFASAQPDTGAAPAIPAPYRAALDRYCVTCHNTQLLTANLALDAAALDHVAEATGTWEKVIRKLRARAMPPPGRPRPEPSIYEGFASWLETTIDRQAAARPNAGRPPARRLNRFEYTNAVRDLLALEIDGRALLPSDETAFGFDNNADMLPMSSALLERYMSAAAQISRRAVGDPAIRPSVISYVVSRLRLQDSQAGLGLPFGSRGGVSVDHYFPLDAEYVVTVHVRSRRTREPHVLDIRVDGERAQAFTIGGRRGLPPPDTGPPVLAPDVPIEVRLSVPAGARQVGVTFVEKLVAPEGLRPARLPVSSISFGGVRGAEARVESIDIAGPYDATGAGDTASRRRIFSCRPGDGGAVAEACATEILSTLARRAYRRPVTDAEVGTLLRFHRDGHAETGTFDGGIQFALERILLDSSFLVRVERDPVDVASGAAYRLSDLEIASRLSFFLWSSLPDDELVDAATRGALGDPAELERQVRRLLADPRATTLVTNFAAQWLLVRNVPAVAPDVNAFPEFDDDLREAFQRETELFLDAQLREDRSVLELLTADHTFINERLAKHYGIDGVHGSHFRRVRFDDDRRAGLLGQGSILTVTSYANRTSPVVRGKWLLENLLGAPPPPPPPNVPPLDDGDAGGAARSMRDRMEQHRENPACASCHAQMDPLGFALENFDAIGRWRDVDDAGGPVDDAVTLPDGQSFRGPAGLREMLQSRRDELVHNVVSKLLTYALGRGVEAYDMPAIRAIVREAEADDYRWSSIILGIASSTPFQMRSTER